MTINCNFFHLFKLLTLHIYKHKNLKGGLQPLKLSSNVHYAVSIRMRFHNYPTQLLKKHKRTIKRRRADMIQRCSIQ